jgi:hypothetical protein
MACTCQSNYYMGRVVHPPYERHGHFSYCWSTLVSTGRVYALFVVKCLLGYFQVDGKASYRIKRQQKNLLCNYQSCHRECCALLTYYYHVSYSPSRWDGTYSAIMGICILLTKEKSLAKCGLDCTLDSSSDGWHHPVTGMLIQTYYSIAS